MTSPIVILLSRWAAWFNRVLAGISNIVLFAMMVLTFVDVWARYGFNAPIPGGFEITEFLLVILVIVCWVAWTVWQMRDEQREYAAQSQNTSDTAQPSASTTQSTGDTQE